MTLPLIETDRLLLRPHKESDFTLCKSLWNDPVVIRYIGGQPNTTEQVWTRMLKYLGLWAMKGFGYWAIEEKSTQCFIGELGFADFKREITPALREPELGWALISGVHGKGYATEAVRAAGSWGDKNLNAPQTVCVIDPENKSSIRVAEKCGYQMKSQALYHGNSLLIFSRKILPG